MNQGIILGKDCEVSLEVGENSKRKIKYPMLVSEIVVQNGV
jgi:hypothetical protein